MKLTPARNLTRHHIGQRVMVPDKYGVPVTTTIQNIIRSVTGRVAIVYDDQAHWYEPGARVHLLPKEQP